MLGSRSGVTLVEMLIVAALVGLLVGISFPAVSAGVDSLNLRSATDSIAAFLNSALNRAERRQQAIEIVVSRSDNSISLRSSEPGYSRKLTMPQGVSILDVLPRLPESADQPRQFLLYPGGAVPRLGVEVGNRRGARRIVTVDPITGVPSVQTVENP